MARSKLLASSDRRGFLKRTAGAGIGFWVAGGLQASASTSPNQRLQIAQFGVGGKGKSDLRNASRFGKIYALCDIDRTLLEPAAKGFKTENTFSDFRELFDTMGDKIDVAVVSTPDHNHAVIAARAMKMGKHCYCQKPLTHSIYEARRLTEIARETGVATQMGNQWTAYEPMRKAAYQIRAGQLGNVKEVYVWTDRPVWPQGEDRPEPAPVPDTLDWESWIGPAPFRPYAPVAYHDFRWRGWWDFGTGSLGDMACHTCNLPFMALNMRNPTWVDAEADEHNHDSYPAKSKIKFHFPELDGRPAFDLYWSDKSQLPPEEVYAEFVKPDPETGKVKQLTPCGCIIVGDKATMYAAGSYTEGGIFLDKDIEWLDVDYPKPMGMPEKGHVEEFYNAIHNPNQPAVSNFSDYAGPLTETILLGNLAIWKRGRVEWDAEKLEPTNDPDLRKIVHREYRDGYEL